MNDEVVITYKSETVRVKDFNEREKAIYDAGYKAGVSFRLFVTIVLISASILFSIPVIEHLIKK